MAGNGADLYGLLHTLRISAAGSPIGMWGTPWNVGALVLQFTSYVSVLNTPGSQAYFTVTLR